MDLAALLARCRKGDELAWEALVRQFQSRVYGVAYHYTGNSEDARDLTQEAFVRLYQNISLLPEAEGFLPWLIRVTRNACIDALRRKKARPPAWDIPVEDMFDLQASGKSPEEQYVDSSRKRLVYKALQEMTDLNREIILLKEIQGLALEEIASMLGVPLGTVKSRSNRARIELAQKLTSLNAEFAGHSAV
jgi:RNA polymerase sigma-70 factor (ECF subfamily)